jgi:hypothetical protein
MDYTPQQHERNATIAPSKGYPRGRFPIGDAKHAKLALEFLPRAKNMSGSQKAAVRARADRKLAANKSLEGR